MDDDTPNGQSAGPASPFGPPPETARLDRKPILVGCGVGCSVLVLLGMLLLVALTAKSGEILRWSLEVSQQSLLQAAPEDWTAADTERLRDASRAAADAVLAGKVDAATIEALQRQLFDALLKANRQELTRRDLLELVEVLEAVAGAAPLPHEEMVFRTNRAWLV